MKRHIPAISAVTLLPNMIRDSKYSDNKELLIIPEAVHTDLYDKKDIIPFEKLERGGIRKCKQRHKVPYP